jgi:hypothetical protein
LWDAVQLRSATDTARCRRTVSLLIKTPPERSRSPSAEDAEDKVGDRAMPGERYVKSFYLIVTDKDNGTFSFGAQ